MCVIQASIERYHEKIAVNFLTDWIKKHIELPSKEKAIDFLKKNIKSEEDLDDLFKAMPKMITFLKSKKAELGDREYTGEGFPPNFIKHIAAAIALISLLGISLPKERTVEKLREIDVLPRYEKVMPEEKYMGSFKLTNEILKNVKWDKSSYESMNKELIKSIQNLEMHQLKGPKLHDIHKVKYPLELKFTLDKAGDKTINPKDFKNIKENTELYVHRDYTPERLEKIEKTLKELKKNKS